MMYLSLGALVLGGMGAWGVARWGGRFGLWDYSGIRSSHSGAVPKGGGIGILAAFILVCLCMGIPLPFWLGATAVSLISLYGDRREISPFVRLGVQLIAGVGLVAGGIPGSSAGLVSSAYLIPFLAVFIAGTANYYNFMDGINGIAGISGVVGFWLVAYYAITFKADLMVGSLAFCTGMACLGFLPFNIPGARVFMGDVGSILLGFVFAGTIVCLASGVTEFLTLCAFLFPFFADELTTVYFRLKEKFGQRQKIGLSDTFGTLLVPHRQHLYQLLANEKGIDHWKVSLGYGVMQLLIGVTAIAVSQYGTLLILMYLGLCFMVFFLFSGFVRRDNNC